MNARHVGPRRAEVGVLQEYRVSWQRRGRPLERVSRIFQFRVDAERAAVKATFNHFDVRLERRPVGQWHECKRGAT